MRSPVKTRARKSKPKPNNLYITMFDSSQVDDVCEETPTFDGDEIVNCEYERVNDELQKCKKVLAARNSEIKMLLLQISNLENQKTELNILKDRNITMQAEMNDKQSKLNDLKELIERNKLTHRMELDMFIENENIILRKLNDATKLNENLKKSYDDIHKKLELTNLNKIEISKNTLSDPKMRRVVPSMMDCNNYNDCGTNCKPNLLIFGDDYACGLGRKLYQRIQRYNVQCISRPGSRIYSVFNEIVTAINGANRSDILMLILGNNENGFKYYMKKIRQLLEIAHDLEITLFITTIFYGKSNLRNQKIYGANYCLYDLASFYKNVNIIEVNGNDSKLDELMISHVNCPIWYMNSNLIEIPITNIDAPSNKQRMERNNCDIRDFPNH
jgi:hypothetical protein